MLISFCCRLNAEIGMVMFECKPEKLSGLVGPSSELVVLGEAKDAKKCILFADLNVVQRDKILDQASDEVTINEFRVFQGGKADFEKLKTTLSNNEQCWLLLEEWPGRANPKKKSLVSLISNEPDGGVRSLEVYGDDPTDAYKGMNSLYTLMKVGKRPAE